MDLDAFFSRLNPAIDFVLRSRIHWLLSPGLILITVTGRKTGRRYRLPVGYQPDAEGVTVLVSKAARKTWWRNYRESGPVQVHLRGRIREGTAHVVAPGSDEFRKSAARTLRRMPWLSRQFGIDYDRRVGLTEEQARRLTTEIAVVRVELTPSGTERSLG
jgi:deazaflavin-dependent oxidoreductase (nitroreductase family)